MTTVFVGSGAEHHRAALTAEELQQVAMLANGASCRSPGWRIQNNPLLDALLVDGGTLDRLAKHQLGKAARAVRAVLFNKTEETNWGVPWHQDRTIAVQGKHEIPGYSPWSRKAGLHHVEPPFELLSQMITLRVHLDACDNENAPLKYVPGSHCLGRIPMTEIGRTVEKLGSDVCLADSGDVWLYATGIVHASDPAAKPGNRRVLQLDFSATGLPKPLEWLGI